jgi:hypothetical protein
VTVYASSAPDSPGHTPVYAIPDGEGDDPRDTDAAEELDPRLDIANHSPTGLSWGYRGSGAAQTALAILAHEAGADRAQLHYQDLKDRVIAEASQEERLVVTSEDISEALGGAP